MSRGILTISDHMSFDELDGWLGQAMPVQSAVGPSPIAPFLQPGANVQKTPGIFDSITSIIQSGAQAYGAYAASRPQKQPAAPLMPYYGPTLAPTSMGLSGTEIALIVGGGILVLGVGALLVFRK